MTQVARLGERLIRLREAGAIAALDRLGERGHWFLRNRLHRFGYRECAPFRPNTPGALKRFFKLMQFVSSVGPVLLPARQAEFGMPRLHRHGHQIAQTWAIRRWRLLALVTLRSLCLPARQQANGQTHRAQRHWTFHATTPV